MFKRRLQDSGPAPKTFIAAPTAITGRISGQGAYIFCGRVEGDCDIEGLVTLAETGHWKGTLRADEIVVAGTVDGDVIARARVEVARTARITGSLAGHSIAVAQGAVIEGEIRISGGGTHTTFEEKRKRPETPG